jgi:hypothetical protein
LSGIAVAAAYLSLQLFAHGFAISLDAFSMEQRGMVAQAKETDQEGMPATNQHGVWLGIFRLPP